MPRRRVLSQRRTPRTDLGLAELWPTSEMMNLLSRRPRQNITAVGRCALSQRTTPPPETSAQAPLQPASLLIFPLHRHRPTNRTRGRWFLIATNRPPPKSLRPISL